MPRKKKAPARKTSKRKGSKGSNNLAVYLMIAVVIFGVIYWVGKPVAESSQNQTEENSTSARKKAKKHKNPKKKVSRKELELAETKEAPAIGSQTVETSIYAALAKLNIPKESIKRKKADDSFSYLVPIDPAILDLTFSNMIIKGEVEKNKGQFLNGLEKGGRQFLTFYDAQDKSRHVVELYYKRDETLKVSGKRALAIVVDDFGNIDGKLLNGFMDTDPNVVFAIMPNTPNALRTMNAAHTGGRETIIHIPMEPMNYPKENPGDKAIFIQNTPSDISKRMERFINDLPYCKGANNHMGSLATADETTMRIVMQSMKKHNMYFLDSRTTSSSLAYKVAQKNLVPAFKRDIFLDEPDLSEANLNKRLSECVALSASKSYVVVIMHCHTANHLNYLNRFIAKAKASGFEILPLSKLGAYNLPQIR